MKLDVRVWIACVAAAFVVAACGLWGAQWSPPARADHDYGDPYPGEPMWIREAREYAMSLTGPEGLASADRGARVIAKQRIRERYEWVGNGLIGAALKGATDEADSGAVAMRLLGHTRFARGVAALAPQVDLRLSRAFRMIRRRLAPGEDYPAAYALAEIGMPSVPAMLKNLAESDDEKVRDRSAWVINKVFVGKKAAARVFLEDAIKEAQDDDQRQRLIDARKFFE